MYPSKAFFVPEIVQTSAMDCGPAALVALLAGFGINASYGRLRETCQTSVDGTSIDTLEEVAAQLGLQAEQVVLPLDHLLLHEAAALPALVVVLLPGGATHFVIAWRQHGRWVQVMDPAVGRRWVRRERLLEEVYVHELPVPAAEWRTWAGSDEFLVPLRRRLRDLGLPAHVIAARVQQALDDPHWHTLAALDTATRTVAALIRAGGVGRGSQAVAALSACFARTCAAPGDDTSLSSAYWFVRATAPDEDGAAQLLMRGAVLVRVRGSAAPAEVGEPAALAPELRAALDEPPVKPLRELFRLLRADGLLAPTLLLGVALLTTTGVVIEGLLFQGLLELGRHLAPNQRLYVLAALLVFGVALLLLEWVFASGVLRLGRQIELRLRTAFLHKIPRLGDRYFHSRPVSDMAERSHTVHRLRLLLELGRQIITASFELVLTVGAIIWLYPASRPVALITAVLLLTLPFVVQPTLAEYTLRLRTHAGALGRFYLDALLGLVAVRAHGAERAVRRSHAKLLAEWARAGFGVQRVLTTVEGVVPLAGFGCAAWLLFDHLGRTGDAAGALLLVYWALKLPTLGTTIALAMQQYPNDRATLLRLLEPLQAPDEHTLVAHHAAPAPAADRGPAAEIVFADVSVQAGGHTILRDINLHIAPGSHVAIVGSSGAGKSSLVGLLLGWHRPACGQVCVDGEPLDGERLAQLRTETAWVDPAVQLWNRSMLHNVQYGAPDGAPAPGVLLVQADLLRVLERLPQGLQTPLGEGGGLVSGGEGQRVRLARALARPDARLVILDEPFRGLDRTQRHELLGRAQTLWRDATLLCITHDLGETASFQRVLVVEEGQIVEDGSPAALAAQDESRYRTLLDAETHVREQLWAGDHWRRLHITGGRVVEEEQNHFD